MRKQLILVLLAFIHVAVFAQNGSEKNLPIENGTVETMPNSTSEAKPFHIGARLDFGGILSAGYNPFGIGLYNIGKRKLLNIIQLRFELGIIPSYGFYFGPHLGLGQNFNIDKFDIYLTGNYGITSVGIKEFKKHGRFMIPDYSVDLGIRYSPDKFPGYRIFSELSYSGKKPIHIRIGLAIN